MAFQTGASLAGEALFVTVHSPLPTEEPLTASLGEQAHRRGLACLCRGPAPKSPGVCTAVGTEGAEERGSTKTTHCYLGRRRRRGQEMITSHLGLHGVAHHMARAGTPGQVDAPPCLSRTCPAVGLPRPQLFLLARRPSWGQAGHSRPGLLRTVRFLLPFPPLSSKFLEGKHHIPFTPCPLRSLPWASAIGMLRARWVNARRPDKCAAFCGGGVF